MGEEEWAFIDSGRQHMSTYLEPKFQLPMLVISGFERSRFVCKSLSCN